MTLHPYHGERHPVDLVLVFGFVLSEGTVTAEIREGTNKCKATTSQVIAAVATPGKRAASLSPMLSPHQSCPAGQSNT